MQLAAGEAGRLVMSHVLIATLWGSYRSISGGTCIKGGLSLAAAGDDRGSLSRPPPLFRNQPSRNITYLSPIERAEMVFTPGFLSTPITQTVRLDRWCFYFESLCFTFVLFFPGKNLHVSGAGVKSSVRAFGRFTMSPSFMWRPPPTERMERWQG